jgi:hypothetical protein
MDSLERGGWDRFVWDRREGKEGGSSHAWKLLFSSFTSFIYTFFLCLRV